MRTSRSARPVLPSQARPARSPAPQPAVAAEVRAAAVLDVVRAIPPGRVTTYGQVAARAGLPRQARLVGRVLGQLPADSAVPWHRVVAAGGRIAFPSGSAAWREQGGRLRGEGVTVERGRIDLERHGWSAAAGDLDRWLWSRPE